MPRLGRAQPFPPLIQRLKIIGTAVFTTTQTLLGKGLITATTLQTLLGKSRITATTIQTLLGKARIKITTLQTILGIARVTATTLQTLLGKGDILKTTLQTLLGKSRITITTIQTLLGKSRITITTLQTLLGKARITATTLQTLTGKGDILKTTLQTLNGLARITITTLQTLTGKARITITTLQTLLGKARITATTLQTLLGKGDIKKSTSQTLTGLARITITTVQTLLGKARVTIVTSQTLLGKSRITALTIQTLLGKARITATSIQTLLGKGDILKTTTQTLLGKSRITATTVQTLLGKARVTVTTLQTLLGKGKITGGVLQTILGKSRITIVTLQTLLGKGDILKSTIQTLLGKSRITRTVGSYYNYIFNPSFETNEYYYGTGGGLTKSQSYEAGFRYAHSLKFVASAIDDRLYATIADGLPSPIIGQQYTFSCYLRGSGNVKLWVYDGAVDQYSASLITLTSTWTRYSLTITCAGSTMYAGVRLTTANAVTGYMDSVMFEANDTATTYFDGSFPGASWTGTTNNSTSYINGRVVFGKSRISKVRSGPTLTGIHVGSQSIDVHTNTQAEIDTIITAITSNIPNGDTIAIGTYLDYPEQVAMWADSIHRAGKKMWLRSVGFDDWQGTNGVTQYTTADFATHSKDKWVTFINTYYAIFKSGDYFSSVPDEPENNSMWNTTYGTIGSGAGQTAYNSFITDSISAINTAFSNKGVTGVETAIVFTNPSVSKDVITSGTAATLTAIATDDYPESGLTLPADMETAMASEVTTWINPAQVGKNKILTIGPSVYTQLTDANQAEALKREMKVLKTNVTNIYGIFLWQFGATDNAPKSRLFDYSAGVWTARSSSTTVVDTEFFNATVNKTLLGKARITKTVLQTLLGKARITITTIQTLLGKADIKATTLQTLLGKGDILKTTTKTLTGIADIIFTALQTLTGKARITVSTIQTLLGKSRITATTLQTLLGKARITITTIQTLLGQARITIVSLQTLLGKSRIIGTTLQTLLGKSRITVTTIQTLLGKGDILNTTIQTLLGKSRITITTLQTLLGKSRITVLVNKTLTGISKILGTGQQFLLGKSRITVTTIKTLLGKAKLVIKTTQTITGKSNIISSDIGRIWSSGLESGTLTAEKELDGTIVGVNGLVEISTTVVRTGTYSLRTKNTGVGGSNAAAYHELGSADQDGPFYIRAYIYVVTGSTSDTPGLITVRSAVDTNIAIISLNNTDIQLEVGGTWGTVSSVALNTWHRIELYYFNNGTNSVITAKFNGVQFGTTTFDPVGIKRVYFGPPNTSSTTYETYFDDLAINTHDWAGAGSILHRLPTSSSVFQWLKNTGAAGDNTNYTRINEVTPNDNTNYLKSKTAGEHDDVQFGTIFDASVGTLNVVQVGVRYSGSATANSSFHITTNFPNANSSSVITPSSATWVTNTNTIPHNHPVTQYSDTAYNFTGAIVSITIDSGNTNYVNVSTLWVLIDFNPPIVNNILGKSRITAKTLQTILGLAKITATTLRTITGLSRIQRTFTQVISGISRISVIVSQTLTGKANINNKTLRTIKGKGSISSNICNPPEIILVDGRPALNVFEDYYVKM